MTLRIDDQATRTDTGRQRNANEDSLFTRAALFVVADGMGGAQAGEVASKTAAESFDRELPPGPPEQILRETIEAANRAIHERARNDPDLAGMGTTITAAIVVPEAEEVAIGHVGDSRAYRLRAARASSPTPRPPTTRSAPSSPVPSAPNRRSRSTCRPSPRNPATSS